VKIKIQYNRRYSMVITMLACASSVWMMINTFGFPVENVIKFVWICLVLLVALMLVAVPLAFVMRKLSDSRNAASISNSEELSSPEKEAMSSEAIKNNTASAQMIDSETHI
jgi:dolichyl-phosphate-mannose--protein O-mannosyl transferase